LERNSPKTLRVNKNVRKGIEKGRRTLRSGDVRGALKRAVREEARSTQATKAGNEGREDILWWRIAGGD